MVELWDAVTGERAAAGRDPRVELELPTYGSRFVVFRSCGSATHPWGKRRLAASDTNLPGPWNVTFDSAWGGPDKPVTFDALVDWTARPEPGIRHYSGTATYRMTFDAPSGWQPGDSLRIDLGTVHEVATVFVNGTLAGTVTVTSRYKGASWASVTLTGDTSKSKAVKTSAYGSVSGIFGGTLDLDTRYQVQVTATFTCTYNGATVTKTATASAYVPYAYITMDLLAGGHGVAFGQAAVREGLDCAMHAYFTGGLEASNIGTIVSDNGTVSVQSDTGTAIASLTLDAGTYVIEGNVGFASNATGRRMANLATASGSVSASIIQQTGAEVPAVSGGMTALHTGWMTTRTAQTTVYLNVYQDSGAALSVTGYIRAMRIQ